MLGFSKQGRSAALSCSISLGVMMLGASACTRDADTGVSAQPAASAPSQATTDLDLYYPLQKGSYRLYEVYRSTDGSRAYMQVLVTDETQSTASSGADEAIVSTIDHSLPPMDRADEPTIIRRGTAGLECLDCGGLFFPADIRQPGHWSTTGSDSRTCSSEAITSHENSSPPGSPDVLVVCVDNATGTSISRLYQPTVGPTLTIITGVDHDKPFIRIERLLEHRIIEPSAPFPALPSRATP